jgi:phosphoglucosamine mutase
VRQPLFGTDGMRGRFGQPPLDRATVTALGRTLATWLADRAVPADIPGLPCEPPSGADLLGGAKRETSAGANGRHPRDASALPQRASGLSHSPHSASGLPQRASTLPLRASARAPEVVLGGDTRESTPELCSWIAAGLAAGGAAVRYAGVIPTPGVSHLAARLGAAAGVVVSASHNPYPDNGIKLLDSQGRKWSAEDEAELEERLWSELALGAASSGSSGGNGGSPTPGAPRLTPGTGTPMPGTGAWVAGSAVPGDGIAPAPGAELAAEPGLREIYVRHLLATARQADGAGQTASDRPLAGLRIVIDAGNGAASYYARELFEALGAEVVRLLCAAPDGRNVNLHCGSTSPERMAADTVAAAAHLGVAFDGDADRCIFADERGTVRDGDAILYLWATSLLARGLLTPPRIVATSMSNLGLERALARHGIGVTRCGVGDRAVVETMLREGIHLGGEQSGHIVHLDRAATGDGLLTAMQIAVIARTAGSAGTTGSQSPPRPLSDRLAGFRRYPQVLLNVRVARKPDLATVPGVAAAARRVEQELGTDGRLVLRYSGTESLARVMIEGPDQTTIETLAARLATVIATELGNPAGCPRGGEP